MTKLGKGKEKGEKKVRRGQREKEREGMKEKRREQKERREERKGEKRQPTIIIVENFHSALSNRQDLQKKKNIMGLYA